MCTIVVWSDNDIAHVSARNMDWFEDMQTDLWVFPRGIQRVGLNIEGENSLDWTSKYGSVVANVYGIATADGVNEEGLGAHLLWLGESDYGTRDRSIPGLSVSLWGQFFLDNFASTAEAVAYVQQHSFQIVTLAFSSVDYLATIHLQIEDASGDVAIFEYVEGKLEIHHSPDYCVMTNSPVFEKQLENLKAYEGFGGETPLPGSTEAADRFVRAAYYLKRLRKPTSELEAIAGIISVVRNVAQPFVEPDKEHPNTSATIWRTVIDHAYKTYYFESTVSPYLFWLDLPNLTFTEGAPIRRLPVSTNLYDYMGESSGKLIDADAFTWAMPEQ
jgi:penicillin V acylase-like amidase (Ntn superfamily)